MGVFEDCVFFIRVDNLSIEEKGTLHSSITSNGGVISLMLNHQCTHVLVDTTGSLSDSQMKTVQKHQILIVDVDFVRECLGKQRLIQDYQYPKDMPPPEHRNIMHPIKTNELLDSDDNENNIDDSPDTEVAKYCFLQKGPQVAVLVLLCLPESSSTSFSFKISTIICHSNGFESDRCFQFADNAELACQKYEKSIKELKKDGYHTVKSIPADIVQFLSGTLQKVLDEDNIIQPKLSLDVRYFVEMVWTEALSYLDKILSRPVNSISLNDVSKAEGVLFWVRKALDTGTDPAEIKKAMVEFYQLIPHKEAMQVNIDVKLLSTKQDLCQLIRDIVNVCEINLGDLNPSSFAKYRALQCRIEHIDPESEEFLQVSQQVLKNQRSEKSINIIKIFCVSKLSEATEFQRNLGNVKSLFHASSPHSFVGILSRGLLLPKCVEDELGLLRGDAGNLGSGIYFRDSISTSVKYAEPAVTNGARLIMVCDVALGNCKDVCKTDSCLTAAPSGFHSVHDVRQIPGTESDFEDDEFVVYKKDQVRMRYVVQFCTDKDTVNMEHNKVFMRLENMEEDNEREQIQPDDDDDDDGEVQADDKSESGREWRVEPRKKIKRGLQSIDGKQIPLDSVHVKGKIIDIAAEVTLFQTYVSHSTDPIEAKYVFPLDSSATVCGFEAFINGRHFIGEVKEKEQANEEYRASISEGHGVNFVEEEAAEIFSMSLGTLPPEATVIIKVTYITMLSQQNDIPPLEFCIPSEVASWETDDALKEDKEDAKEEEDEKEKEVEKEEDEKEEGKKEDEDQDDEEGYEDEEDEVEESFVPEGCFSLELSIEMPCKIESIKSETHLIKLKQTECKAVVTTSKDSDMNYQGFKLEIKLKDISFPRLWVEKHPEQDSEIWTCPTSFIAPGPLFFTSSECFAKPTEGIWQCEFCRFNLKTLTVVKDNACMLVYRSNLKCTFDEWNVTICLDCSNSMEPCFESAKDIALGAIDYFVYTQHKLNVVLFGTNYKEFYAYTNPDWWNDRAKVRRFIKLAKPNMGSTELWKPLQALNLLPPSTGMHKIFLISDGHIQNESLVFKILNQNAGKMCIYSCAVGATANKHIMRSLSQQSHGLCEYFEDPSTLKEKVELHADRLWSPSCWDISVKWQQANENYPKPIQAPTHIPTLFPYKHLLVCAFAPDCTQVIFKALFKDHELDTVVSATELQKTTGTVELHADRLWSPSCWDISVKWQQANENYPKPIQAPTHIPTLFPYKHLLVCAFAPDCTQVIFKALFKDHELDTVVSATELQKTTGTLLHRMTARAIIRDYEDEILHLNKNKHEMKKQLLKPLIIGLSKKYAIVSQFTCFVAGEKQEEQRNQENWVQKVLEMISALNVDILPHMDWDTKKQKTPWHKTTKYKNMMQKGSSCRADEERPGSCNHSSDGEEGSDSVTPNTETKKSDASPAPQASLLLSSSCLTAHEDPTAQQTSSLSHKERKCPSFFSLSALQCEEGYWQLNEALGSLININVNYLLNEFLVKNGIQSLGSKGKEEIPKLIATLLVLQVIRTNNLQGIKCKTLMSLDESSCASHFQQTTEKAMEWVKKRDNQYPGICYRLGMGKDWESATRKLLSIDPVDPSSDLYPALTSDTTNI